VDLVALGLSYGTSLRFLLHKGTGRLVCTTDATGEADAVLESAQIEAEVHAGVALPQAMRDARLAGTEAQ